MSHVTDRAASEQAIRFLASLAADDQARQRDELERLYDFMATPAEMHSMFFAMVQMAGGMWEAANGLSREFWTFEIQTPSRRGLPQILPASARPHPWPSS